MKNIRRDFHRLGRHGSYNQNQTMSPANGSFNESTPLLGRNSTQSDENESRWKSIPKHIAHLFYEVLVSNYVNVLLVFVPLGIIAGELHWNPTVVFILNFIAIIPLAALLSFATEELSAKLGQTLGGLMNASFGNAVELIVSIVALKKGEIRIVQSSMLGSILSNMLLVLGCCFLAAGIKHDESSFNSTVASTMSSLMAVASASLIIPATLYAVMNNGKTNDRESDANILLLSHGTSIILLIIYILYLYFQLKSHHWLFAGVESQENGSQSQEQGDDVENGVSSGQNGDVQRQNTKKEEEEPQILTPVEAGFALVIVTVMVALCADYLVGSIDSIVESAHISKTFVGLILIPIVGNAAEHVTAVIVAYKNKMDLAINVAVGSSLQIALFVTPFLVVLGWIMDRPMTLHFQGFETIIFFISVLIVNYLIQDGKSNYLEGAMCVGIYAIIALAFYIYPDDAVGDIGPKVIESFFRRLT